MTFHSRFWSRLLGLAGSVLLAPWSPAATIAGPNILFIGVDDLRPELNCYGATHIKSPNIDRLAAEGVLFERAYCQWAVCMPSRASLLSGLRPDTFQGKANAFRKVVPDVVTLPQHFKNHGYFTQSFGKIYHGSWETAYVGNSYQDPVSWSVKRWAASPQYYFSPEGIRAAKEVFATSNDKFLRKVKRDPTDPDQWKRHFVRGPATFARATGGRGGPGFAVQSVRQDARDGRLTGPAWAREEVGVTDPPLLDGAGEHLRHRLLPDDLGERRRAVLAREDEVGGHDRLILSNARLVPSPVVRGRAQQWARTGRTRTQALRAAPFPA